MAYVPIFEVLAVNGSDLLRGRKVLSGWNQAGLGMQPISVIIVLPQTSPITYPKTLLSWYLLGINYAHPNGRLGASEHCSVYKVLLHSLGREKMVAEGFFFNC